MADLVETFVEGGNTYRFEGGAFPEGNDLHARGILRLGGEVIARIDVLIDRGGVAVDDMTEQQIEDATVEAVIEWVRTKD